MKIGFDFDGVISNCGKLKSDGAKKLYGVDIAPEQFKKEFVIGRGILTKEQYRELQRIIYETRKIGFLMEPVENMLFYLPKLFMDGHDIRIITWRSGNGLKIAKQWFGKWPALKGLNPDFVGVGKGNSKAEAAAGRDIYVDDDLDKLEPLVEVVLHRYLFSWGYNKDVDVGSIAKRVSSWEDLYRIIQDIEDGR